MIVNRHIALIDGQDGGIRAGQSDDEEEGVLRSVDEIIAFVNVGGRPRGDAHRSIPNEHRTLARGHALAIKQRI